MPAMIAARFSRVLPLLIILAVLAVIIYLIASWRYTPAKAKEVLIRIFTWLNVALSAVFLLATLYSWLDGNAFVAEFFLTFLATTLIVLLITYLAKRSFLKHHPNYQWHVNASTFREKVERFRSRFK